MAPFWDNTTGLISAFQVKVKTAEAALADRKNPINSQEQGTIWGTE